MTGHPFVFAVWAVREEALKSAEVAGRIAADFQQAKTEGLKSLERIASEYAPTLRLPIGNLIEYLQTNVNYDLDPENLAGLVRYYELAARYGLIPENRPLSFLSAVITADGAPDAVWAAPKWRQR